MKTRERGGGENKGEGSKQCSLYRLNFQCSACYFTCNVNERSALELHFVTMVNQSLAFPCTRACTQVVIGQHVDTCYVALDTQNKHT